MVNCIHDRVFGNDTHSTFWTETWANYLSKQYFGNKWLGLETKISGKELRYFPSKNITLINILNLF